MFDTTVPAYPSLNNDLCEVSLENRGLWYKIVNPSERVLNAVISEQSFSPKLAVFASSLGDCESVLQCVTTNTRFSSFSDQSLTWAAEAGTTSYVYVVGDSDLDEAGDFLLSIQVS